MNYCSQVCEWNTYEEGCTKPFAEICPLSNMHVAKDTNVPTNADHIRSMTDEELAKWLFEFFGGRKSDVRLLNLAGWLKQPYKEDT